MVLESIYDSVEFEGAGTLRKLKRRLKIINNLSSKFEKMSLGELKTEALNIKEINVRDKKKIHHLYALAREVCFRLLGKRHYDVQILGALAALDRQMIQMSTGSGKTLTLILPTLAYGFTHKGVMVLTVNEYLSKRDWEETKVIYDFFGLTNAYTSNDESPFEQHAAFGCDITYCTNSTLGFAYLNSNLASGIGQDVKPIARPLHAAIIDEVDEILMDDARNPLIIAEEADLGSVLTEVDHDGRKFAVMDVLNRLRTLKNMDYDEEDGGEPTLGDKAWDEICELLDVDDSLFANEDLMHVIYSSVNALFKQKAFDDYVVEAEPDPDSGSRVVLIDKATGRLARGRTLNDSLHAFVEMKEGVFTGKGTESTIQITYQVLFNLFPHITGVTGTLGKSYKEFMEIYNAKVIAIPDRLPNQLKQQTHLYVTENHLFQDLPRMIRLYQASRHPILIGCASDIGAVRVSDFLKGAHIDHKLLISTDNNEEVVIASAGQVGSIVVTTDIMGRGTDIHIAETDYERGLVVLQVGGRPNSRVERQFAGRAARQGDPGRYHRLLSIPELEDLGVMKLARETISGYVRENRELVTSYAGDMLMDGGAPYYDEVVTLIDEALVASESSESQGRIRDFRISRLTDLIQVSLVAESDWARDIVKDALVSKDMTSVIGALATFSLVGTDRTNLRKLKRSRERWERGEWTDQQLLERLFQHTERMVHELIPRVRTYSEGAVRTAKLTQVAKMETKPEDYMSILMTKFMNKIEADARIPYPDEDGVIPPNV